MGRKANKDKTPAERYAKDVVRATTDVMNKLGSEEQKDAFLEYTKMIMLYVEQIALYYANALCSNEQPQE